MCPPGSQLSCDKAPARLLNAHRQLDREKPREENEMPQLTAKAKALDMVRLQSRVVVRDPPAPAEPPKVSHIYHPHPNS